MWNDAQVHVIEEETEKDAATAGSGGVLIEGLISVESAKRLNSGAYAVKGMIIQVSNVIQMVETTDFKCQNCSKTASHKYNPPLLSLPSDLQIGKATRDKCETCGERFSFEVVGHTEVPGMKIQLQDERKQNALEGLDVVLFGTDTINIRTGENCMVYGELHVVQRRDVRVTYLFGNTKGGAIEYEKPEIKDIELTPEDLDELNKFQQQPDVAKRLTQQFAPTIISHDNKKLAILLQYIGAPESRHFRGRIHALLIGPPGLAKTALAREAYQLGYPSSRFSSAQGASVKTITAIIDKENEFYVIRLGVLPQARNSLCILDEVASHSTEEQKYLFGCMEEGKFTIDKHGFHREIDAPTSVLGTTNPETADWFNNVVEKGQIPLRKELVDRYDYVLVFKATTEREKKLDYAKQRLGLYRQLQDGELVVDYTFLQKFIQHARSFESVRISEEAEAMIAEYWSKLDSRIFPTNRVLETIQRTSMAFARLHFSNTVTVDIVNEAVAFITEMFQEFDQTVAVVKDPRDIACEEVIKYLEETPGQEHTFEECLNHAVASNTLVEAYFGKVVDNQSKKFKELANRFKLKEVSSAVSIVSLKPLKLVFKAITSPETEQQKEGKEGNK
jgi:DNA replicative helicase MCM subunit Mcm2 (Cdc46/Mcm family)